MNLNRRDFVKLSAGAGAGLFVPAAFAAVNARNGVTVNTSSTINGRTPNSAINGQSLASASATEFITATTPGTLVGPADQRGMKITVGGSSITVTELGIYGNASHYSTSITLYIRSSGGTDLGNCSVGSWGTAAQWYWGTLGTPVVLSASTVYYIMTDSLAFNDVYGTGTTVTPTSVATVDDAAYGQPPADEGVGSNRCSGPLNFKYT